MSAMEKYQHVLAAYRDFEQRYWGTAFVEEKQRVLALEEDYKDLAPELSTLLKWESPGYNIFSILNIRHYEEKVHTPFLCNLLNPQSSHQQEALFLNLFFEMVLNLSYRYESISHFSITEEQRIGEGRIDIILLFYVGDERIGIIIENKIYAKDQKNQLQRYHNYLKEGLKLKAENRKIYYLSPWKQKPGLVSISEKTAEELRKTGELSEIGYHAEIIPWLEASLCQIQSPRVQLMIQQYIQTLEQL